MSSASFIGDWMPNGVGTGVIEAFVVAVETIFHDPHTIPRNTDEIS
jgi:hypothetical protein